VKRHYNQEEIELRLNWDEVRARMIKLSRRRSDNRKFFKQVRKLEEHEGITNHTHREG
jgi:hypothetical protein